MRTQILCHRGHPLHCRRRLQQAATNQQQVRLTIRNALSNLTPAGRTTPPALLWASALSPRSNYSSVLAAQGMPNVSLSYRNATTFVRQVCPSASKACTVKVRMVPGCACAQAGARSKHVKPGCSDALQNFADKTVFNISYDPVNSQRGPQQLVTWRDSASNGTGRAAATGSPPIGPEHSGQETGGHSSGYVDSYRCACSVSMF